MIEDERSCEDVLLQLIAIRSAIHKISIMMAQSYTNTCLLETLGPGEYQRGTFDRVIELLMKLNH